MTISVDRFETYQIQRKSQLIVNLAEVKAILVFADRCGLSVGLHFDRPGRPLIVAVEENIDFRLLSTIESFVA